MWPMRRPVLAPRPRADHLVVVPERAVEEEERRAGEPVGEARRQAGAAGDVEGPSSSPSRARPRPSARPRDRSRPRRPRGRAAPCPAPRRGGPRGREPVRRLLERTAPRSTRAGSSARKIGFSSRTRMDLGRGMEREGLLLASVSSPATWSMSPLVTRTLASGTSRGPVGCSAGVAESWARMSGEALITAQAGRRRRRRSTTGSSAESVRPAPRCSWRSRNSTEEGHRPRQRPECGSAFAPTCADRRPAPPHAS
jgi:hypothetical protein